MRSKAQIKASIKSIITAAVKFQERIQELAVECIAHAKEHGDATLIADLVNGLPNGQRTESLREWVHEYSPIRIKKDGGCGILKKEAKGFTDWNLEAAAENPYYKNRETVKKPLTLEALVKMAEGMVKRVDKAEEEGNIAEGQDTAEMKAFASAIAAVAKAEAANKLPA